MVEGGTQGTCRGKHIRLYSTVMDGYIHGFITEERTTRSVIITHHLANFLKPIGPAAPLAFLNKI